MRILCLICAVASFGSLHAGEVPWTPEAPYNYDRRQSASEDDPSPWASSSDFSRVEYRLTYLMEADRNAIKLARGEKLDENDNMLLHAVIDDLDEALEVCYREAIPCFKTRPNPTLLLMMLYHYDVYVNSAMERWEPTIEALRQLDPATTQKPDKLSAATKAQKSK
jgi:hypothetical protein